MNRREFTKDTLHSLLLATFAMTLWRNDAIAAPLRSKLVKWVNDINSMAKDLKGHILSPLQGQRAMEAFFRDVDIKELMKFVDCDRLMRDFSFPIRGEREQRITFPAIEGMPTAYNFRVNLTGLKKGRSIPPHVHENMVTGFLVLKGEFHGRNFDRKDDGDHFILTPTIDKVHRPGDFSSISDEKDNAHWFTGISDTAFLFDMVVKDLQFQPDARNKRMFVDLRGGKMDDGRIYAKRMDRDESYEIYG